MIQSSGASVSDADIRAAQTLTEVQGLLKNFDENVGLANTLADAIAGLSQEMMSAEKDRREVFDARSAEASSNGVSLSNLKPANTATGSPDKPRRKANRGVPQENVDGAIHTNETNLHSEFVVERSQIEETTFHTRNVKTIFSNPGTDKSCITPFSQVGQIEPAEPSSPLDDISELFPPTPTRSNDQRTYAPLRAARMSDHRAYDGKTQTGESRQSTKSRPARRASVQGPHSLSRRASDNIASKKMPEKRAGISNAARAPTPRADEPTSYSGRTVGFNDPAAAGAAFGRMKTSKAQTMPGSSTQVPPSPRGILNEPNTLKRSAATAGFQAAGPKSRAGKSSKVSESQRNSLGPIIGGSQSPRKATRRNGGRRASKGLFSLTPDFQHADPVHRARVRRPVFAGAEVVGPLTFATLWSNSVSCFSLAFSYLSRFQNRQCYLLLSSHGTLISGFRSWLGSWRLPSLPSLLYFFSVS